MNKINAEQKIQEFESLEEIQLSEEWNKSLFLKIQNRRNQKNSVINPSKLPVLLIFMVLINIGIVLKVVTDNPANSQSKTEEYKVISDELLIPSTSNNK